MASDDAGYNPLAYHNGTVWPHDNSLIAWGLARYGRQEEALRIIWSMLEAASFFDFQLPEVFAGFSRADASPSDRLPDRVQAAGLGGGNDRPAPPASRRDRARRERGRLVTTSSGLPDWLDTLRLAGIPALGTTWTAAVEGGKVLASEDSPASGVDGGAVVAADDEVERQGLGADRRVDSPASAWSNSSAPRLPLSNSALAHSGETHVGGSLDVVEADDGELVRDTHAQGLCRLEHAKGLGVRGCEDRRGRLGRRSKSSAMFRATCRLCVPSRT